jgi:hypothetical protein
MPAAAPTQPQADSTSQIAIARRGEHLAGLAAISVGVGRFRCFPLGPMNLSAGEQSRSGRLT